MPEKLLIVTRHFWPENCRINELCGELAAAGWKIDVLCGQPSRADGEFFTGYNSFKVRRESRNKINIYRTIDVKRGNNAHIRVFLNYTVFPLAAWIFSRKLMKNSYAAVLIYQTSPVFLCASGIRIAKKRNIPVYIYAVQLWPQSLYPVIDVQSGLFRRLLHRISMHYYQKADALAVPSVQVQNYLKNKLGVPADHFPVVPLFPDPRFAQNIPDENLLDRLAGSFHVVVFGDFENRLSVETLIQTACLIRSGNARNIRFIVTGAAEKIHSLYREVQKNSLQDWFYFEGAITAGQTGTYIHVADLILVPADPEEIDEYMIPERLISLLAAGKPLVVSLSGLIKNMMKEGGFGISTEPYDAKGLYEGIMKIYRMTPEQRAQMGERTLLYQQQNYSCTQSTQILQDMLKGTAPEGASSTPEIRNLWDV